jgi:SAM-dependent methyltransferase
MAMKPESEDLRQIDDAVVESYFDGAGGTTAAAMSMMAHGHNLPLNSVAHRLAKELRIISGWLDALADSGRVLDVGCGAGAWVEIFAKRFSNVIGVERSPLMVEAARNRVANTTNAQILNGDGRKDLPGGPFELIFVGGLFMYLNDSDALALLYSLQDRLCSGGSIILRESTVRNGELLVKGKYQAIYRSVDLYHDLFQRAGILCREVRQNSGYNDMVIAEGVVDFRRKWLSFLPKDSIFWGSLTWWALKGITPISFWASPKILSSLNVPWPRLQNHFFLLQLTNWEATSTNQGNRSGAIGTKGLRRESRS